MKNSFNELINIPDSDKERIRESEDTSREIFQSEKQR